MYPFHPLYGQTVEITGSIEHDFCRHFLIRQDHGGAFYLPAWMITPEAGLIKPVDTPRLPLERLHDLRALLDLLLHSHADELVSSGDVDAPTQSTRSAFLFYLVLSYGPKAPVSVQVKSKDEGDHTPPRSSTTKRETIRPSPLPGINAVPGNGPIIAQEPGYG